MHKFQALLIFGCYSKFSPITHSDFDFSERNFAAIPTVSGKNTLTERQSGRGFDFYYLSTTARYRGEVRVIRISLSIWMWVLAGSCQIVQRFRRNRNKNFSEKNPVLTDFRMKTCLVLLMLTLAVLLSVEDTTAASSQQIRSSMADQFRRRLIRQICSGCCMLPPLLHCKGRWPGTKVAMYGR